MSKPRHQLRRTTSRSGTGRVKVKLRLPTDGSVDLGKLRAALEAQLKSKPEPVIDEPVVVEPEPVREPSEFWLWIKTSVPTVVALFSAILACLMGIFYLVQKSAGADSNSSLFLWAFLGSLVIFVGAFAVVIRRQLAVPNSPTAEGWMWVKKNPKWIYIPSLCLAFVAVIVLWAMAISQSVSGKQPDDLAKAKPKEEIPVSPPVKGEPKGEIPVPPPVLPPPVKPPTPTESESISLKPQDGWMGRLMAVLIAGGALGFCGFQMRRKAGVMTTRSANAAYIDFWPGFRHFVAAQGGFLLVAAATGAAVLAWDATRYDYDYSLLSAFLWALPGMGLAGLLLLALGACGINPMPNLDRTLSPAIDDSAIMRFIRRKIPHVIFMGVVFGGFVSVWRVEAIGYWISYWLKWTLSIGLVVAVFWNKGRLGEKMENVRPLPKKNKIKLSHVMIINMPLVAGLTLPVAFGIFVVTGAAWVNVGWIAPLLGLGVFLGVSLLVKYPRLLRHWQEIIFFPGIVAFICDWLVRDNSFWYVFGGLASLFAFGKVMTQPKDTESGRLLVFSRKSRDYRPVLSPERDGLKIRWGGLAAVVLFSLLMLVATGKWVWSGSLSIPIPRLGGGAAKTEQWASLHPLTDEQVIAAVKELVRNGEYGEAGAWEKYAGRGYPIAQYHWACWQFDVWRAGFGGEIPLDLFSKAGREGHLPSIHNEGICHYYGNQLLLAEEAFYKARAGGHPWAETALNIVYSDMEKESIRPNHIEEVAMPVGMKLEQQAFNREWRLQLDTTDEVDIPSLEQ